MEPARGSAVPVSARAPTPTVVALLSVTPTPAGAVVNSPVQDPYRPLREFLALPTFTPAAQRSPAPGIMDGGQVIVFDRPPANIYITFADGPGLYEVDVVDQRSTVIQRLLQKRVLSDHGEWAVWNGKDALGMESPVGDYWVLLSKEGRLISRISVRKANAP